MTAKTLLWVGFPYAALAALIIGLIWRWRKDQFGWTSRSSQWHENAILRWASPLFHFGILFVFIGHVVGMLIPKSVTAAVGVSDHLYHLGAVSLGGIAGLMTVVGAVGLIYRRVVIKSVRFKTTKNDVVMYVLLMIPIVLGVYATLVNQLFGTPGGYDYRETIGPWIR
ncbi:MAG: respiratory nitrate reductase subunit gamma, partial [Bowdeniella nasicola]|nr:respiratory nitrate reductase subunit gamma [Bowdeniella nasicola]